MNVLYNGNELSSIAVEWSIFKGTSAVPESFYGTQLGVTLEHSGQQASQGRFYVNVLSRDNGVISFQLPDYLPVGTYGLKAVWTRDRGVGVINPPQIVDRAMEEMHSRHDISGDKVRGVYNRYSVAEVSNLFAVTDVEEESTIGAAGGTIRIGSKVATYGRDGLDAYERALMLGQTMLNETEWMQDIIADQSITTEKLADGAVTTDKIADKAVQWQKLADPVKEAILGDHGYAIEFVSSMGLSFRRGYVNTVITPHVFRGKSDITNDIDAVYFDYTRETQSGKTQEDTNWDYVHRGIYTGVKTLALTNADMPEGWTTLNKTIFTLTVTIHDGDNVVIVQNQIIS